MQVSPVGTTTRVATSGLVLILVVLTVFSVAASVMTSRGTEQAQRAAADSELYETASEALFAQEERAEDVVSEDDADSRSEYATADLATRSALQSLERTEGARGSGEVEWLLETHRRYGAAVQSMFNLSLQAPGAAELYEATFIDLHFDPLSASLDAHVKSRYEEARAALASIGRTQQLLVVATPTVFGGALVLLTTFMVMLGRSRRLVGVQADENRHQSLHDALTGLPNRTLLHRRGATCLQHSTVTGEPVALMLLDLDRFKEINDTLGHHHGDLVLQAVSQRLQLAVRSTDTVVRLGGDEFAILLPEVQDVATALIVATQVQEALRSSVDAGGVLLDVDISMGVALSGVHGDDIETLLQHADIAMYRAKEHDLGVCVYDDALNEHSRDQLGLLGELRRAIDNDELVLHFQPKVTLPTGAFWGAEALLRWEHPTRGLIPPAMFIPAAERTALIRPLTAWVLNAALAECKRWQDEGQTLKLAVNVSARNLLDASFGDDVLELLSRWDLPTSCLLLEVTESAVMVDPARAEAILRRFSGMGIELAIDDFGAGYTSLGHLRTLPVQELKIDQSLVRQMSTSAADALIIGAVIELAHSLGLRTVAEGVEDADTLERLSILGCDLAQGYHLARPMPAAALSLWAQGDTWPLSPVVAPDAGSPRFGAVARDLQPSEVIQAAEAIAAAAAAEVAADAAFTAQAAVVAACAAALQAAEKAERVAAQAAGAAAGAAAMVAASADDLRQMSRPTTGATGSVSPRSNTSGRTASDPSTRTAQAAASAVLKVAAGVEVAAAVAAAASAEAAGLIEQQLAEHAADAVSTLTRTAPHPTAGGPPSRSGSDVPRQSTPKKETS